jgi:membrane-bound serine protease (ClpP class)
LMAFALFAVDIQVTGFALSIAGAISFVIGSLLLFSPFGPTAPAMPQLSVSLWLLASITAMLVLFFTVIVTAGWRAQRRTGMMLVRVPQGARGIALTDLDPEGVVQIQSETWSATTGEGPVKAGQAVEVIDSDGLRVRVRGAK